MLTGSGQAANFYAIFNIAGAGDHIVSSTAIYGGTYNLFNVTLRKLGIDLTFVSPSATEEELEAAIRPNTKAVFLVRPSPTPAWRFLDIEKVRPGGPQGRCAADRWTTLLPPPSLPPL